MSINLTLNFIRDNWCSATKNLDRRSFCLSLLPDCYDHTLCENQGSHFFQQDCKGYLADQTVNSLMRGNRKSSKDPTCATVAFTKDLLTKLQTNATISYLDPDRPTALCVSNMLDKIRGCIRRYATPRSRSHHLFTHADFGTLDNCDESLRISYHKVRAAVNMLLERESEHALSYAIFLLVITAILQDRLPAVDHLYSLGTIEQVLEGDTEAPLLDVDNRMHIPFTDPNYMNPYWVYLYRETSVTRLITAHLSMTVDERQRPWAVLTMDTDVDSPFYGKQPVKRVYSGKPMLNRTDQMVYLALKDSQGSMLYLTFPYTPFGVAPMYFRSATLITTDWDTGYPQAQKVAITAREMTPEEIPYIEGIIRTGGKRIMISQKQLSIFKETFRDYPWMEDFLCNYEPIFQSHQFHFYCFNEDELLNCSTSELPYTERLKIMLALKSVTPPNDPTLEKFLKTAPASKTYSIMK